MTGDAFAACAYAALAAAPAFVQLALVFGAPWGQLTMGGRWPGRLPARGRALAAVQCAVVVAMAVVVLGAGDVLTFEPPTWLAWVTLALATMTAVANSITPSRAERRLWMPITFAMLLCAALAVLR